MPVAPSPAPLSPASAKSREPDPETCRYCPNCDSRLDEQKCKLICRQCGYFMSCADYH